MPANSAASHIPPLGTDLSSSLSSSLALLQVSEKAVPSWLSEEESSTVKHWVAEQAEHMQVDADAAPTPPFTPTSANVASPPPPPVPTSVDRPSHKRTFDSALALYPPPPRQTDPPGLASTSIRSLTFHSLPLTMNLDKGHILSLLDLCGVSEKEVIKVELRTIIAPRGSSAEKKPGATTATTRVDVEFEKAEVCARVFKRLAGATWKGEKLQVTSEFKPR